MMTDLPEIKIVKHVRAKRLRLRVEPDAVRLTVPVFCTQKQIQAFLAQSQTWLEKTWQQQMQQRNAAISSSSEALTFLMIRPIESLSMRRSNSIVSITTTDNYSLTRPIGHTL